MYKLHAVYKLYAGSSHDPKSEFIQALQRHPTDLYTRCNLCPVVNLKSAVLRNWTAFVSIVYIYQTIAVSRPSVRAGWILRTCVIIC